MCIRRTASILVAIGTVAATLPPPTAYADLIVFQSRVSFGLAIDGIMTLSPREQDARLQALAPRGHGPQFAGRQDDHAVLAEAIAANRKLCRKSAIAAG